MPEFPLPGTPPHLPSQIPHPRNGMGVAALVLSILAALCCWLPVFGVFLAVVALLTAIAARRRVRRGDADNYGVATIGFVLSTALVVVGTAFTAVFLFFYVPYQNCIDHAQGRSEYAKC
jgi:Domain of unknown function (DUF4190)